MKTSILMILATIGCVATPGAQPHDMSEAAHEAMARRDDLQAVRWSLGSPEEADRHRRMAADHRAASAALRDAEARACVGVPDRDRDMSPFAHRGDIESVKPLDSVVTGKNAFTRRDGAVVTFRAMPGMTAPWLQRVIDCHIARNAALGHDVPEMTYCPLVLNGVIATVKEARTGFAVEIRSDAAGTADEIWRRAQKLAGER